MSMSFLVSFVIHLSFLNNHQYTKLIHFKTCTFHIYIYTQFLFYFGWGGGGIGLHLEWGVFIFGDQQRTNTCKTNEKRLFWYFKIL